jgi:hypothetical protein
VNRPRRSIRPISRSQKRTSAFPLQGDLPGCQARLEKIFFFTEYSEYPIFASVPPHRKGRIMIVANAGRDAVDADGAFDERRRTRTEKTRGPGTSTLVSSS